MAFIFAVAGAILYFVARGIRIEEDDRDDQQPQGPHQVVAMNYNILAKSLGSNCIPWIMAITDSMEGHVSAYAQEHSEMKYTMNDIKFKVLKPQYLECFHKNTKTGDYSTMRRLWCASKLENNSHVPESLKAAVTVKSPDEIEAPCGSETKVFKTMRGILKEVLPKGDVGLKIFNELLEDENEVYAWKVRGPRLFNHIIQGSPLQSSESTPGEEASSPDIVAIEEYDVPFEVANYDGTGDKTFHAAMLDKGYEHAFYADPKGIKTDRETGQKSGNGVGVFWRSSAFQLAYHPDSAASPFLVECGSPKHNSMYSFDYEERYNGWQKKYKAEDGSRVYDMALKDRRHMSLTKLKHKASNMTVWVAASHLMTTSRDGKKVNEYPGEIRAHELKKIREHVEKLVGEKDHLLLMGDFNIGAKETHILEGQIKSQTTNDTIQIATNFDPQTKHFNWKSSNNHSLVLQETFEKFHQWGAGVSEVLENGSVTPGYCTSRNAARVEYIDFMFHSLGLIPIAWSIPNTPGGGIPDREHGSDHLSILARFRLIGRVQRQGFPNVGFATRIENRTARTIFATVRMAWF